MEDIFRTTVISLNASWRAESSIPLYPTVFGIPKTTNEISGQSSSASTLSWAVTDAVSASSNDTLTCTVWKEPARIFLQCFILLFGPILIPANCEPASAVCDILGFFFTCLALFSPLVVIVMAVDRCMAVYFHVLYKANPFLKMKYSSLIILILINGIYLFLPCVTDFSAYVVVPWLSLCFLEWGLQYRLYDLILAFYTSILILLLIVANVAILVKIRLRKRQIQNMHRYSSTSSMKDLKKQSDSLKSSKSSGKQKHHRSAEDVIDISCCEQQSTLINTSSPVNMSPVLKRRSRKCPPPPIDLRLQSHDGNADDVNETKPNTSSPLLRNGIFFTASSPVLRRAKAGNNRKKRPASLFNPLVHEKISSKPNSITSPGEPCISPLVTSEQYEKSPPEFRSLRKFRRVPSADDLLSSTSRSLTPNKFSFSRPLLRQVLDNSGNKQIDLGNLSDSARSSEEIETLPQNQSSASSFFSFAFSTTRNASVKIRKFRKTRKIRKSVSRITKMTITICLVFVILYVPFLIRKLVQLIPSQYTPVSPVVEMVTLLGPFLSPLVNPIIYVFFNPHYKKSSRDLFKKMKASLSLCFSSRKINFGSKICKSTKTSTNKASSLPTPNETDLPEDVFLPDTCDQVLTASKRRKMWTNFKNKNKKTKTERAVSAL